MEADMSIMRSFRLRLGSFRSDTEGSMVAEGVMASTFLIWWYIASFQFFDAYRQKNVNLKAAYTIADMISRQESVDVNYVDGLNTIFDYLTYSNEATWIRVSSVYWDGDDEVYRVQWSRATGSNTAHTDATIQQKANQIPVMPAGDTVIVVETNMSYEPIFRMGLDARWYDTFIVTRPRVYSCVAWESGGCNV
jgi:Flp pilus assembly protein TadG